MATFLAGDILTAANLNAIFDWTSYTPTLASTGTQPTIGSSTRIGKYRQVGKLVEAYMQITIGSGFAAGTGTYLFSLPVANTGSLEIVGFGYLLDNGTAAYGGISPSGGTTTSNFTLIYQTGQISASSPFTPASGDKYVARVMYEVA